MYALNSGTSPPEFPLTGSDHVFVHYSPGGWTPYRVLLGDFNGDMDIEAAYIRPNPESGRLPVHQTQVAAGTIGDGKLQYWPSVLTDNGAPPPNKIFAGSHLALEVININGDALQDIVAAAFLDSDLGTSGEFVVNALSVLRGVEQEDSVASVVGLFDVELAPQVHPVTQDWSGYDRNVVADVNGDGRQDFVWVSGQARRLYVAYGKPDALN